MKNYDLSILIPARNEMFLSLTVENILKNIRGNTEIIVGLDGAWANPGIVDDPRLTIVYHSEAIGQRAMINELARISQAKYVMKIDAHCAVDEGFDVKMMAEMHDDWTLVPMMYNLHGFDWVCEDGHRIYQAPTPKGCLQCGKPMKREIVFTPRWNRKSCFYRFDKTLHFQYFGEFGNRPEGKPDVAPTMSLQGSCFMLTRDKYWELNICDEAHGSWGQQGVEVACKTWFSGGQVMVNKKTWYSHMFRTQGGDFGFPFPLSGADVDKARKYSRELFLEGKWKSKHDLNWLLEKFKPVPDWHFDPKEQKKLTKGVVYYTNNVGDEFILDKCRKQIKKGIKEKYIVSVSLKPLNFGNNYVLNMPSGYLTMAKQILEGLVKSTSDIIFFCEHDVLYHPSHFDFIPYRKDVIYYNTNVWRIRYSDGHALYCNNLQQLSGLVGYRETLIKHYQKRVELLEKKINDPDFNKYVRQMGFEPGTHNRKERVDDIACDNYQSKFPNIDIRHETNLTPSRWNKDQFRNQKYTQGWTEADEIPSWGITKGRIKDLLSLI
mgnify:CR=1 FL=1